MGEEKDWVHLRFLFFALLLFLCFSLTKAQSDTSCPLRSSCSQCVTTGGCRWCSSSRVCETIGSRNATCSSVDVISDELTCLQVERSGECSRFDRQCGACVEGGRCAYCEEQGKCVARDVVVGSGTPATSTGLPSSSNCTNWVVDTCPHAPCSEYLSCNTCLRDEFCGWCMKSGTCAEGDVSGPLFGFCPDFRYGLNASCACGNGVLDLLPGGVWEECDDGNINSGDGCSTNCRVETCGDGYLNNNGTEECDDGNEENGDLCNNICKLNCVNGLVDMLEECDDGNLMNTDACSNNCTRNLCGNGRVDPLEECDDGNLVDFDNCTNLCTFPACPWGVCPTSAPAPTPSAPRPFCGNGYLDPNEECDGTLGLTSPNEACDPTGCFIIFYSAKYDLEVSDTGFIITMTLKQPITDQKTLDLYVSKKYYDCAEFLNPLTVYKLGSSSKCWFANDRTFVMQAGINQIFFLSDDPNPKPPSKKRQATSITNGPRRDFILLLSSFWSQLGLVSTDLVRTILLPNNPIVPQVIIVGLNEFHCISTAMTYPILDATGSYGSGGRTWVNGYQWNVTTNSPLGIPLPQLNPGPLQVFSDYNFPANLVFNFSLTLENWLGGKSTVYFSFVGSNQAGVNLFLQAPQLINSRSDRDLNILVRPSTDDCYPYGVNNKVSLVARYSYGPAGILDAPSSSTNILFIPRGSLQGGFRHGFVYEASLDPPNLPVTNITESQFTINVISSPLIAEIIPQRAILGTDNSIVLDATSSFDPDYDAETPLFFSWSCVSIDLPDQSCALSSWLSTRGDSVLTIPPYNLPVGRHQFILSARKGGRLTNATSLITIIYGNLPVVTISKPRQPNSAYYSDKFNPSEALVLDGRIIPTSGATIASYKWSLATFILPETIYTTDQPSFVMPANSLLPGIKYTFILNGTDTNGLYSLAYIELAASIPPDYGTCAVDPANGVAGSTNFDIICTGWEVIDSGLSIPIVYYYYWLDADGNRNLITGPLLSNYLSTPLPIQAKGIQVRVADGSGASRDSFAGNVSITLPTGVPVSTSISQFEEAIRTQDSEKASILANAIIQAALNNRTLADPDRKSLVESMIRDLKSMPFPSTPSGFRQRAGVWDSLADLSVYPNGTTSLTSQSVVDFQSGLNDMLVRANSSDLTLTAQALTTLYNTTDKLLRANSQLATFTSVQANQDSAIERGVSFPAAFQPGSSLIGFTSSSSSSGLPTPAQAQADQSQSRSLRNLSPDNSPQSRSRRQVDSPTPSPTSSASSASTTVGGYNTGSTGASASDFTTGFPSSGPYSGGSVNTGVSLTGSSTGSFSFSSASSAGYTSTQGLASTTGGSDSFTTGTGNTGLTVGGGFSTGDLNALGNVGYTAGYTGGALAGGEGYGLGPQPAQTLVNPSAEQSSQQLRYLINNITFFQLKNLAPNQCFTFTGSNVISYICRYKSVDIPLTWTVNGFGTQTMVTIPQSLKNNFTASQIVTDFSTTLFKDNPFGYLPSSNGINSYVVQNQFFRQGIPFAIYNIGNGGVTTRIPKPRATNEGAVCREFIDTTWVDGCDTGALGQTTYTDCSCTSYGYIATRRAAATGVILVPGGLFTADLLPISPIEEEDHDIHPQIILLVLAVVFGLLLIPFLLFYVWKSAKAPKERELVTTVPRDLVEPERPTEIRATAEPPRGILAYSSDDSDAKSLELNIPHKRVGIIEFRPPGSDDDTESEEEPEPPTHSDELHSEASLSRSASRSGSRRSGESVRADPGSDRGSGGSNPPSDRSLSARGSSASGSLRSAEGSPRGSGEGSARGSGSPAGSPTGSVITTTVTTTTAPRPQSQAASGSGRGSPSGSASGSARSGSARSGSPAGSGRGSGEGSGRASSSARGSGGSSPRSSARGSARGSSADESPREKSAEGSGSGSPREKSAEGSGSPQGSGARSGSQGSGDKSGSGARSGSQKSGDGSGSGSGARSGSQKSGDGSGSGSGARSGSGSPRSGSGSPASGDGSGSGARSQSGSGSGSARSRSPSASRSGSGSRSE